jgi:hypothetical protein
MTSDLVTTSTPSVEASAHEGPGLVAILRRVALNLLVAMVIPGFVFYSLYIALGVWPAIVGALCWSYGAIAFRAVTGRRTSGMLLLTAGVLTARTIISLLAHSTFIYFLQPVLTDVLVGSAFLLSLLTARPVVARLAGDFYPLTDEINARPAIILLFRRLTLLWALVCLAKAAVVLWLLLSQPLPTFVMVRAFTVPTTNVVTIGLTIIAAAAVARREGLSGPRPVLASA